MPQTLFRLWLAVFALLLAPPALAADADSLAEALALPTASGLVGAADRPVFAWIENAAGIRNVWVARRGQTARRLTAFMEDDGQQIYGLTLTKDGTRLAFVRGGDGEFPDEEQLPNTSPDATTPQQQVFVIATAGGAAQAVGRGHSPTYSADGQRLAFTRRGELWLWAGAGEAQRVALVEGEINRLAFSPDGSRLLFSESRDEHSIVALFDLASSKLRYLDAGLGESIEPVFSPRGDQIAFIRFIAPPPQTAPNVGRYWSIRLVDADTGIGRALWSAPAGQGGRYAGTRSRNLFWSRDGQILFPWEQTGWLHVY
ncbi:MAG: TolB family protein, partial [Allosphingosinicella sp.]